MSSNNAFMNHQICWMRWSVAQQTGWWFGWNSFHLRWKYFAGGRDCSHTIQSLRPKPTVSGSDEIYHHKICRLVSLIFTWEASLSSCIARPIAMVINSRCVQLLPQQYWQVAKSARASFDSFQNILSCKTTTNLGCVLLGTVCVALLLSNWLLRNICYTMTWY